MKWLTKHFPSNPVFSKSLFSSIFLTLFFGVFVVFFYLFRAETSNEFYSALFWSLLICSLYFLILKTGEVSRYRVVFFVTFAVFFIIGFISSMLEIRDSIYLTRELKANLETPFCHIVIPQTLISAITNQTIDFAGKMIGFGSSIAGMIGLWFLMSLTIGRGWCSWVCFFGGCDEGFSKLGGKKKRWNIDKIKTMRYLPFAVLVTVMLLSFFVIDAFYCVWLCPFKTTTEFAQIVDVKTLIGTFVFLGLFVSLVVVLPILTKKRTQCGLFCPFGAFESFFNKVSIFRVEVDAGKCVGCQKCVAQCPTFSMVEIQDQKTPNPSITCARCGKCMDICPKSAINYKILGIPFNKNIFTLKENDSTIKHFLKSKANEILDARVFFIATAFLFGAIISSSYLTKGLLRVIHLFTDGTLLLK